MALSADGAAGSLAMIFDVSEARRIEREMQHHALHDPLTGLPNRVLLNDRLSMALSRQKQDPDYPGVEILVEVAHRLRTASRPADTVARLGGDEFVVVAEGVGIDAAVALAEHMRRSLLEPIEPICAGHTAVYVDANVGVALAGSQTPASLLRSADDAMYQGKSQGRIARSARCRQLTLGYPPIVDLSHGRVVAVAVALEALLRWSTPTWAR